MQTQVGNSKFDLFNGSKLAVQISAQNTARPPRFGFLFPFLNASGLLVRGPKPSLGGDVMLAPAGPEHDDHA
jgi:hypothetical protein